MEEVRLVDDEAYAESYVASRQRSRGEKVTEPALVSTSPGTLTVRPAVAPPSMRRG